MQRRDLFFAYVEVHSVLKYTRSPWSRNYPHLSAKLTKTLIFTWISRTPYPFSPYFPPAFQETLCPIKTHLSASQQFVTRNFNYIEVTRKGV